MTLAVAYNNPPKLRLTNIETREHIDAQFNPTQFSIALQVNYGRHAPPGSGYVPLQYGNTGNPTIPLELMFFVRNTKERDNRDTARRFLLSFCYPRRGAVNIPQHAPPRLLVTWPQFVTMVCVVTNITMKFTLFNSNAQPIQETYSMQLEESRDGPLFSDDINRTGVMRPSPIPSSGRWY
jgi:hypothetical protein